MQSNQDTDSPLLMLNSEYHRRVVFRDHFTAPAACCNTVKGEALKLNFIFFKLQQFDS